MKDIILVFDFFGVISSEVAPLWLEKHFDKKEAQKIKNQIVADADIGLVSEQKMFEQLAILTKEPADKILQDWLSLSVIDQRIVEFIKTKTANYTIALLSNAPAEFLHKLLKKYDLYTYFNKIIISSEVGIAKPSPQIYQILLNELNCNAGNTVMIDDNPNNIKGAEEVGMNVILYDDYNNFIGKINEIIK